MQSYYQNERDDYNTALLEETAGIQNRAYSVSESQKSINQNKEKTTQIDSQIRDIQSRIDLLITSSQQQVNALDAYHSEASRLYTRAYIWFKIIQTTLLLLFTGTVFGLLYRFYLRHKLTNSPHTIIFSVATFAY
jgi:outer membrane murein-binding lipoprotein Lpp